MGTSNRLRIWGRNLARLMYYYESSLRGSEEYIASLIRALSTFTKSCLYYEMRAVNTWNPIDMYKESKIRIDGMVVVDHLLL